MKNIILRTKNLKKIYKMGKIEFSALNGVDLEIEEGEFVAIMGSSGSGKTTLLNMIGLLDFQTEGKIFLDNTDVATMDEQQRASYRLKKIGFVFQFFNLLNELTGAENVMLPGMIKGSSNSREKALELLQLVGLKERAGHKPSELSGGQQQRVSIARALINDPRLILADEPTANLDSNSAMQVVNLLRKLRNEQNQTIVMVTHELELGKLADRIIWLKDGMVIKNEIN
ncbi:MAG: ABC transporter ATP-binding protein [Candidatus Methanoperedens sp.]